VVRVNAALDRLIERRPELSVCRSDILSAFTVMCDCFRGGGKLLLCGNGGSAADCEHWSGELLKGFVSRRPLSAEQRKLLPSHMSEKLQGGLPAIPLPSLISAGTAFANDVSADMSFAQLVWALGSPGDVLVGLSTSGNAPNVCLAAQAARAKQMTTIGLTGLGGGRLAELADIAIRVPVTETYEVQELHASVYHCLCLMVEEELFPD
jgi:D-sedoheptulose 7-phosphate isomerase